MSSLSIQQKRISSVLKLIVIISAILGTCLSAYAGRQSFMGGTRVFMYFTIQSNLALAVISCIGLFLMRNAKSNPSRCWQIIKFVGTVSITLTGMVFCFVLAPTLGDKAWNVHNVLTHVVVPVASVADFFVIGRVINLKKSSTCFNIIPPLLYAIYAGIGYVRGWEFAEGANYPYFFLNWGSPAGAFGFTSELPFMGSAWWILVLFCFLLLVGLLYLKINEKCNHK